MADLLEPYKLGQMWTPSGQTNQLINEGLGTASEAYDAADNRYSPEFKAHLQRVLEGGEDPVAVARELKAKLGGMPSGQGPAPQAQPMAGSMSSGFAGQSLAMAGSPAGLGSSPQPMRSQLAQSGLGMPATSGPQVSYAPQQTQQPQQQPMQAQPQQPWIQTGADVRGAMSLAPYMQFKKTAVKPVRDYIGEENNKQKNRIELEDKRQGGRMELMDARNAQRQIEQAAELAYKQDALDETTAHHIDTIRLGYARLATMEKLLDKNIDWKKESGADEMLKTARTVVDSLSSSEAGLIGSAFASTPEGQKALVQLRATRDLWAERLNQYATDQRQPVPTTSSSSGSIQTGGAATKKPAGQMAPPRAKTTPAPAPAAAPKVKYQVGQVIDSKVGKVRVTRVDNEGNILGYVKVK